MEVVTCPASLAPIDGKFIPLFAGCSTFEVVQDVWHQQYHLTLKNVSVPVVSRPI